MCAERTEGGAGEGELVLGLTQHGPILPEHGLTCQRVIFTCFGRLGGRFWRCGAVARDQMTTEWAGESRRETGPAHCQQHWGLRWLSRSARFRSRASGLRRHWTWNPSPTGSRCWPKTMPGWTQGFGRARGGPSTRASACAYATNASTALRGTICWSRITWLPVGAARLGAGSPPTARAGTAADVSGIGSL